MAARATDDILASLTQSRLPLSIDTEFDVNVSKDCFDYHNAKLVGVSVSNGESAFYVPIAHKCGDNVAKADVVHLLSGVHQSDAPVYMHNASVDIEVIYKYCGIDFAYRADDTRWLAYKLYNGKFIQFGLKDLVKRFYDHDYGEYKNFLADAKPGRKKAPFASDVPIESMRTYAEFDAYYTALLGKRFVSQLRPEVVKHGRDLTGVLVHMMRRGVGVDAKFFAEKTKVEKPAIDDLADWWCEIVGVRISQNEKSANILFGSGRWPTDGAPTTPGGKFAMNKKTYDFVRAKCRDKDGIDLLNARTEWAKRAKVMNTYLMGIPRQAARHADGRLRCVFKAGGAKSGRLSSSQQNLQNIPKEVKEGFVALPGHVFVALDYSQAEVVTMLHFSKDPVLERIVVGGESMHDINSAAWGVERFDAKRSIFALFYGGGPYTLQANVGFTDAQAHAIYEGFLDTYKVLTAWKDSVVIKTAQNMYSETLLGHRRWFPDIRSRKWGVRTAAERAASNHVIQGTVADIMNAAIVRLKDYPLVLQVHDSLVFEVPEDKAEWMTEIAKREMIAASKVLDFPLDVSVGVGRTLLEAG